MSTYDGGGDMAVGGFFVHLRDQFGRCQWAVVTAQHPDKRLNLKVIPNDPDQMVWRPKCAHGAGHGEWHFEDQCKMTTAQIREDDEKAHSGLTKAACK